MIIVTNTRTQDKFTDGHGKIFQVVAKYNPNEENDPWVKYYNINTNQEYTCRLEAFLARFMPIPD